MVEYIMKKEICGTFHAKCGKRDLTFTFQLYYVSALLLVTELQVFQCISHCSKSSFIRHAWGMGCADRSILPLERTVTKDTQF
jgi:hypothetical protein